MDLSQVMMSALHVNLKGIESDVDENILRHLILNIIRANYSKFKKEYGELVIATDGRDNWRKKIFPYYKAMRKKNRDNSKLDWNSIFNSLSNIRDELKEYFPYRVVVVDGVEADDIIGTLSMKYGRDLGGEPILILSGDKDFVQLQKYSNIKQFDPTRKKWLNTSNATNFLNEHIIKGDTSDGVPNFLSDDDVFVTDARQKPITSKKLDVWLSELSSKDPKEVFTEKELRNWQRNRMLIDLGMIPTDIQETIMNAYHSEEGKSRSKLFNYFIKYKLKNLTERMSEF